jgi:hypothetical protein
VLIKLIALAEMVGRVAVVMLHQGQGLLVKVFLVVLTTTTDPEQ